MDSGLDGPDDRGRQGSGGGLVIWGGRGGWGGRVGGIVYGLQTNNWGGWGGRGMMMGWMRGRVAGRGVSGTDGGSPGPIGGPDERAGCGGDGL